MAFWDLTVSTSGRFHKAGQNLPDGVYRSIEWLAAPVMLRETAIRAAVRSGYTALPDCVFVGNRKSCTHLVCGWAPV